MYTIHCILDCTRLHADDLVWYIYRFFLKTKRQKLKLNYEKLFCLIGIEHMESVLFLDNFEYWILATNLGPH